ncbi:MAG: hypothetical protein JRN71_07785 [Nitrososphaerota archaeon]|nr:hypothetical protein [Nitrososphaerota archaeon]MDG6959402.1 hypothetical protein [Nitrososphaerota archaeon]MDG6961605.1 hypothetical protein [Nitrososphaerota archaeon]MDG6968575.1 hypothetical protein [Nitrososphaerota archaeon]MDG6987649.1 hypothetical protein [Nitrososphaerota archaeon]
MKQNNPDDILEGTTRRVFRFVYRQQNPVGIHDVQRGLGLSSPSVAHYHIGKLVKAGLLKEEGGGYVVDKVVFENMIRVRRAAIPLQTAYAVFLLSAFALLVTVFRPAPVSSTYVFAVVVIGAALAVSMFEAYKAMKATV